MHGFDRADDGLALLANGSLATDIGQHLLAFRLDAAHVVGEQLILDLEPLLLLRELVKSSGDFLSRLLRIA
jgi:hypothetical protein